MTERDKQDTNPPASKDDVALIREAVMTPGASVECSSAVPRSRSTPLWVRRGRPEVLEHHPVEVEYAGGM